MVVDMKFEVMNIDTNEVKVFDDIDDFPVNFKIVECIPETEEEEQRMKLYCDQFVEWLSDEDFEKYDRKKLQKMKNNPDTLADYIDELELRCGISVTTSNNCDENIDCSDDFGV